MKTTVSQTDNHISLLQARKALDKQDSPFIKLFEHGSLEIELYKPDKIDHQLPHTRDEVYVIIAGRGDFILEDDRFSFSAGDVIFVPANADHRFVDFTDDFTTWVMFYGPEGGE